MLVVSDDHQNDEAATCCVSQQQNTNIRPWAHFIVTNKGIMREDVGHMLWEKWKSIEKL